MDLSQFSQAFFVEAIELLAQMEQLLLELDVDSPDSEQLNAIFRAAHSIKGGAATFGFTALTETTHLLETLLDRARHGQLRLSGPMIDAFLETKDALQEQLTAYQAGKEPEAERGRAHLRRAAATGAGERRGRRGRLRPAPAAAPVAGRRALRRARSAVPHRRRAAHPLRPPVGQRMRTARRANSANLGKLLPRTRSNDQFTVMLETTCDPDDIIAVCCFVIDESQIDISRERAPKRRRPKPARGAVAGCQRPAPAAGAVASRGAAGGGTGAPARRPRRGRRQGVELDPRRRREGRPADQPGGRTGDHAGDARRRPPRTLDPVAATSASSSGLGHAGAQRARPAGSR